MLSSIMNVVVCDVWMGWPTDPGWWRDSAAFPSRVLVTFHSLYTCEGDTESEFK